MIFKIHSVNGLRQIILLAIFFLSSFGYSIPIDFAYLVTALFQILIMAIYLIDTFAPTKVELTLDSMTISHLLFRKHILLSEIEDIQIDRYRYRRRGHNICRMRMMIHLQQDETVTLTDNASRILVSPFADLSGCELPDEKIKLYQLYRWIEEYRNMEKSV